MHEVVGTFVRRSAICVLVMISWFRCGPRRWTGWRTAAKNGNPTTFVSLKIKLDSYVMYVYVKPLSGVVW